MLESLDQAQLPDIQRLGFGDRANDGMKRLVVSERMDAMCPVGELDDSVSGGGLHGGNCLRIIVPEPGRDLLGLAEDTEEVAAGNLLDVLAAVTAPH